MQIIRNEKNGKITSNDILYFQTFGQAVKTYIKKSAGTSDVKSFEELAAFIDGKLKGVELKINQITENSK